VRLLFGYACSAKTLDDTLALSLERRMDAFVPRAELADTEVGKQATARGRRFRGFRLAAGEGQSSR
jgi:hypothetical protein